MNTRSPDPKAKNHITPNQSSGFIFEGCFYIAAPWPLRDLKRALGLMRRFPLSLGAGGGCMGVRGVFCLAGSQCFIRSRGLPRSILHIYIYSLGTAGAHWRRRSASATITTLRGCGVEGLRRFFTSECVLSC